MRKIINVVVNDYSVICTLENGEKYSYDMNFVKTETQEMLLPLKDLKFFNRVYIEYGSLAWPNGYDIHVNTVVREGKKIDDAA